MDEFALIDRYFASADVGPDVAIGIGDDGAVVSPEPGKQLISVVDTLVEDVHFPAEIDAFDIGFRSVAVNLSDIAAMGGRPRWMTLALTLTHPDEHWLQRFADGLAAAAGPHGVSLIGGDTTAGPTCVVSVQVTGDVDADKAIPRSGAQVGDTIYVSGAVGDAAAGLHAIESGQSAAELMTRFLRPTARVELGQSLVGVANAAIDISDGLLGDLKKLLAASVVGGTVDLGRLPISEALADYCDAAQQRHYALSGGDDYELCFTASTLPDDLVSQVTAIGVVTADDGVTCMLDGDVVTFDEQGYRHFQ